MVKKLAIVGAALLALAGCSSVGTKAASLTQHTSSPPSSAAPSAATPSTPASASPTAAQTPTTVQFGAQHGATYKGLTVSVLSASPYTPSQTAAGTKLGDKAFIVQVRLTNTGTEQFDPTLTTVSAHAGRNGDQGASITDLGSANIGIGFQGAIPPGQSATAKFAFDVPAADLPGSVTVLVSPGFDYQDAPFTGTVS